MAQGAGRDLFTARPLRHRAERQMWGVLRGG